MSMSSPQNMEINPSYGKEETSIIKRGSTSSNESGNKKRGLSLTLASIFIVGEMAGSGVLALPQAIANAGALEDCYYTKESYKRFRFYKVLRRKAVRSIFELCCTTSNIMKFLIVLLQDVWIRIWCASHLSFIYRETLGMIAESWAGIAMLIFCMINTLYAGICLGKCWTILEERYDEYKEKNRYPYAAIAYRACGIKTRYFVSFCNDFTLFGVATVFILLASQLIASLAAKWGISFCYWVLILAVILCPLMWLGTPEDFWPAAILALVTTVVACILLFVALLKADNEPKHPEHPAPSVLNFFLAFGTILFAFGGASSFPTFQNDMNDRRQFPAAATIGFIVLLLLYLPVSVLGYVTYGGGKDPKGDPYLKSNIILSLPDTPMKSAIEVLLSLHLFFAFLLVINAPAQEFEEFFKVPNRFGWKRCLLRTGMLLLVVFVAQSIPRFGKVLDFVGGSTTTLTTSIFPCFFYLRLCNMSSNDPQWPQRRISLPEKIYLYLIMALGIVGGIIATYSALKAIAGPHSFNPPCYVNITAANAQ